MANRYWVGGTASWDGTAGTKWSTTSGGVGGASVPTTADDVFFTNLSSGLCTIAAGNTGAKSINCTGFTGQLGGGAAITLAGSLTLVAGMTFSYGGTITFTGSATITTAGQYFGSVILVDGAGITVQLGDPFNGSQTISVIRGTFATNNHNLSASSFNSSNTNVRSISLGSSTVQLFSPNPLNFNPNTNLTFLAGTSSVVCTSTSTIGLLTGPDFSTGVTFYNLSFTSTGANSVTFSSQNTFNSLTFAGMTSLGVKNIIFVASQVISGSLTISPSVGSNARVFVRSSSINVGITLTCNAVSSLQDVDFRDTTLAGAAVSGGPVSGTRLGDCGGNSGLTFAPAKTVYYVSPMFGNWSSGWSLTPGGAASGAAFPLAQDTAVIGATYPSSGSSIAMDYEYNIGSIDMSARTSSAMTLILGSRSNNVYGNWANGTGVTITGGFSFEGPVFCGRATQTITSAGRSFPGQIQINSVGSSVVLADDLFVYGFLRIFGINCTFNANNKNVVTLSSCTLSSTSPGTVNLGQGEWTIGTDWLVYSPFTILGDGVIKMIRSSPKTFAGGGLVYGNAVLEQAGAGQLTISDSNTFRSIASSEPGANTISMSGTTQTITGQWTARGSAGNLLTILGGSLAGLPSGVSANVDYVNIVSNSASPANSWYAGPNSVNSGSSGWIFSAAPVSAGFFMLL